MQKYYILIVLCSFLYYSYGKIENDDVEQPGTNKIYKLDQNIINLLEQKLPTLLLSIQALDTKMSEDLERNMNFQSVILKKINDLEENINRQFHVLTKNISKTAEEIINYKSDTLKRISDLEGNFIQKIEMLDEIPTKFQENVNLKLDTLAKNISKDWEGIINCKSDALKNVTNFDENKPTQLDGNRNQLPKVYNASEVTEKTLQKIKLPCKEVKLYYSYSPDYSTDNASYNHITRKRNSAGQLTYFEMHMAIKADARAFIRLWNVEVPLSTEKHVFRVYIGWENNQYTILDIGGNSVQRIHTPNILSITEFRAFYIKINDGNLEFGKEGDNVPLISYNHTSFSQATTFEFFHWEHTEANIQYDCPAPVKGSS